MSHEHSDTAGPRQRRRIYYSGHVQGVGFRYTARAIAGRLPVSGFVRNLPDGRVELVAEGVPLDLDALVGQIEGELGRYIRGREISTQPATGEFLSFEIAF